MSGLALRLALSLLTVVAIADVAIPPPAMAAHDGMPHVAVVSIVDHPTVDAMRRGISDSLRDAGMAPGDRIHLDYETAGADLERATAIALALLDGDVDLVIALTEPMARAVADQPLRVPIIVSGIPLAAADAIAANRQARLLTGIAIGDAHQVQMNLITEIRPAARTVLFPYGGEGNAPPAMLRSLTAAARTYPFAVIPYAIADGADTNALLPSSLNPATTVIYLAAKAAGEHADALILEAGRLAIPVVADRRELVVRGATATVIHDYYAIGRQTGRAAAAILRDPTRARQPVQLAEARFVVVSGEALHDRRLKLPAGLATQAREVISWAQNDGPSPVAKPAPPASPQTAPGIAIP